MAYSAGDTFVTKDTPADPSHLWLIISDTDQSPTDLVLVNMTSWESHKDPSCKLNAGDHPFVKHETCISFRDAKLVSAEVLRMLEEKGMLSRDERLDSPILTRIREGADRSDFLPEKVRTFLDDQDLF